MVQVERRAQRLKMNWERFLRANNEILHFSQKSYTAPKRVRPTQSYSGRGPSLDAIQLRRSIKIERPVSEL